MRKDQTKNVRLIIRNADTKKELLNRIIKKGDTNRPFKLLETARNLQDQENWLGSIPCHIENFGIRRVSSDGIRCSSSEKLENELIVYTGLNSFLMGHVSLREPENVIVTDPRDGTHSLNLRLEMFAYASGIVLDMGITGKSFMGNTVKKYLGVDNSFKICLSDISGAYIFQSWKEMYDLLDICKNQFIDLCSRIDGEMSFQEIGDGVKDPDNIKSSVENLLKNINDAYSSYIPKNLTVKELLNDSHFEGLSRLHTLKCPKSVLRRFDKKEDISMRNQDGSYSKPDKDCAAGIAKCRSKGYTPYLAAKVTEGTYDIYTISSNHNEWTRERPGVHSRPNVFVYECAKGHNK